MTQVLSMGDVVIEIDVYKPWPKPLTGDIVAALAYDLSGQNEGAAIALLYAAAARMRDLERILESAGAPPLRVAPATPIIAYASCVRHQRSPQQFVATTQSVAVVCPQCVEEDKTPHPK